MNLIINHITMKLKIFIIAIIIFQLFEITKIFGQAPDLGAASNFGLFTADGAFENTGASTVVGNIGTDKGSFLGFPSGTVYGEIHVADSASALAAIDINIAYTYLYDITSDSVLGAILGNNQILIPNIYNITTLSQLQGDLILDGQGNPDALFIIKINGAYTTSKFSNVILTNSASVNNVYWQINGAFELGDSSVFRGTLVVNGAISLMEGSSLYGRGLSRAGAIALHNNIVETSTPSNPLSINLQSFTACAINNIIDITWKTATETNNNYFSVLRSHDGINFNVIQLIPGAGNSDFLCYYNIADNYPYYGISYYQLKQTDYDGKSTYSNIISVTNEKSNDVVIFLNSLNSQITIFMNDTSQNNNNELHIYKSSGEIMIQTKLINQETLIDASNFSSGIYVYSVIANDKIIQSGKLISTK